MSREQDHLIRGATECFLRDVRDAVRPYLSPYSYSSCEDGRMVVADAASGDWYRVEMVLEPRYRLGRPAWDVRVTMTRPASTCTHRVDPWRLVAFGPDGTGSDDRGALDALAEAWAQFVIAWFTCGGDAA